MVWRQKIRRIPPLLSSSFLSLGSYEKCPFAGRVRYCVWSAGQGTKLPSRKIGQLAPANRERWRGHLLGKIPICPFMRAPTWEKLMSCWLGRALQNNYQCDSDVPKIRWTFVFREQMYSGYRATSEKGSKTENCNSVFHTWEREQKHLLQFS